MRIVSRVHPLGVQPPLVEALRRLCLEQGLCLLESGDGQNDEWSWLFLAPLPLGPAPRQIGELRRQVEALELGESEVPGPFRAGFVGALAYDLGVAGERRVWHAEDAWLQAPIAGGLRADFLVRESRSGATWLVLGEREGLRAAALEARAAGIRSRLSAPPPDLPAPRLAAPLRRHTAPGEHRARVQRLREQIAQGECYQANLAHAFTQSVHGHPMAWYERLRQINPAPYMGYLEHAGGALLSASPELLLEARHRRLCTRPIKGTRRRSSDPEEDAAAASALLASEKDRAELAMIVDLARNDLGRVSRTGSVRVERGFPRLESYASVHHLLADVVGELKPGLDTLDALAALFPGASITGAPKLASMAAIAREEGEGRGYFSGSMGWLDRGGDCAWNILIRTLEFRRLGPDCGEFRFAVGGGITFSSDASEEEEETMVKAARLLETLAP
jgi:para-aminobenzoate synthetase component 1